MTAERVAGFTALLSGLTLALVLAITATVAPKGLGAMGLPMMSAAPAAMTMSGCATMQSSMMQGGAMMQGGSMMHGSDLMPGAMCGGAIPSPSASAIPGATEVRIQAANFSFTPSEIYLPKGSAVNITLVNTSDQTHDITAPGLGLHLVAGAGETRTTSLTNLAAGRYDAYCSVPGHAQLGMRATFIVD